MEKRAGLPAAFLSKARSGKQTGERARESWRKLEGFVAAEELHRGIASRSVPTPAQQEVAGAAIAGAVHAALAGQSPNLPADLAARVTSAESFDDLADVIQELAGAILSGGVDRAVAGPVADLLRERRAALKDAVGERAARELAERVVLLTEAEMNEVLGKRKAVAVAPLMPGQNAAPPMLPTGEIDEALAAEELGGERAPEGWGM